MASVASSLGMSVKHLKAPASSARSYSRNVLSSQSVSFSSFAQESSGQGLGFTSSSVLRSSLPAVTGNGVCRSISWKASRSGFSGTRASASAENGASPAGKSGPAGLAIDLRGKRAFIAGVADDQGYGWAITKSLAEAGAEILIGTWVPALGIFETSLRRGKLDASRKLSDGSLFEIAKVYPMDAVYDSPEDVPEEVKANKRYAGAEGWTVQELVERVKTDFGSIDILVHSLANGPEVKKDLLDTSRKGYLAAVSASSFSFISLLQRFGPIINPGGSVVSLSYIAAERVIPGYGGGMSSAKAALESDTKVLAWEAGRRWKLRVNTISAGPLGSRAARAIGFIDTMINYSATNAPLQKELYADEVGSVAAFLASPLASAVTGVTLYVDNGLHAMGLAMDSPCITSAAAPPSEAPAAAAAAVSAPAN
eukprot:TRINITY_DN736_c0_g1_i1.p1 TRINITY_DN736_c0_g1~~TRINITY_DN736_c0_g1_i1.p1  ORF type:complete len:442 (-),score=118.52 TRINITY_DN736_c0_g1_i1:279-1553(-)